MAKVTLYHTDGCHLCEQALALLQQVQPQVAYQLVDIINNDELVAKYQLHIPVISYNNAQLMWPFNQVQLNEFLTQDGLN